MQSKRAKILVSACLLGEPVRYDAKSNSVNHDLMGQWQREGRFVSICPEVQGGLSTPRAPAEIQSGSGADVLIGQARIKTVEGDDVTPAFLDGAQKAVQRAISQGCKLALMSARSPSRGNNQIYNGQFSGELIEGQGVTASLLEQNGIKVFNQNQLLELNEAIDILDVS
jgi:uncharacterized protein YbbK (DUF523 family)